jgi:hypothetical protein
MGTSAVAVVFVYLALGGAAFGLLEFGVGALLWADQKILIAIGLAAALLGLYLGLLTISLATTQYFS